MSVVESTEKILICRCDLPDCPGAGQPWISRPEKPGEDPQKPRRCRWCKRHTWDGEDRRTWARGPRVPPASNGSRPAVKHIAKKPAPKKKAR